MPTPIITIILDSEDDPYIYEPPPPPEANDANSNPSNVSYAYFEFHPKLFATKQMQVIDNVTKIIITFDEIDKEVTSHYYPKRAVTDEFKTEVYAQMCVLQKAIRHIIKKDAERINDMIEQAIKDYKDNNQPPFTTSILNEIRQGFVDETEKLETIIIYYPEACLPKEQYQNFVTRLQAFSTIKEFIIATRDEDLFNKEPQPPQIVV